MEFATVFMWICLALFGATAVIWLLDMVRVVTIRTPAQRTMLNASLGTTLIGGMASFAVSTFFAGDGKAVAPPSTPSASATPVSTAAPLAAADTPAPVPPSAPPAPQPASCKPAAHPVEFTEWATPVLGTPPTFRCAIGAPYPPCLAELREQPREAVTQEVLRACGADLLAFRQTHIGPAYAAKTRYQDNLDAAEASLRAPRNAEDVRRRAYVINEIARMNGTLWTDFIALDQRSRNDMLACQSASLLCLGDS
ncbi:hypothetical protein [Ralstonia sp.]|uniref:hypothetical protein n=1 Tax=Ralstonia sp. TaxID=54061 RepID=UPI00257EF199|nr:hypothetical protein [Ralstonia sp.]MBA4203339.1 hypothetical protein [Ralstonia sp.]